MAADVAGQLGDEAGLEEDAVLLPGGQQRPGWPQLNNFSRDTVL